ncbi:hypothetical protein G8E10_14235 [Rhizobiaceae bacterium CRRU44]|uniref:Uncharacterized protein n=1 Tax=Ferranicluibacter rubi TaxID=2715133 RepID=A0AA44CCW7_9HYPH|nr:hypothetical protein [Ferranicluibacter rubi]
MTLRGLCLHTGIARATWDDYAATEGFSAISTRAREIIWVWKLELAATNLLNVALIARELGLMDRKSVDRRETVSADNSLMTLIGSLPLAGKAAQVQVSKRSKIRRSTASAIIVRNPDDVHRTAPGVELHAA